MKILEMAALSKAIQTRFRKETEFINEAKGIVRSIMAQKLNKGRLTLADIREVDEELKKIIKLINTTKPLETDAILTDKVNELVTTAQQFPKPSENKHDQTQQRSDKPKTGPDPFAYLLNKSDKLYYIPDEDGIHQPVAGQGEKNNGIKMLTDKQVDQLDIHHLKKGGRKSRRIRRKKF